MALVACLECTHQVSEKAASCPSCGCPIARTDTNNIVNRRATFFDKWDNFGDAPKTVCPHCQKRGCVIAKQVKAKKGVSGGKATAGLLTCGISLLAVGLSRKEMVTQARCKNCNSEWQF